jgi:hypothetical protein
MPIEYVRGDVLKANADIIAHGVNCRGGFGKGIAGQIAKLYPHVRESYLAKHRTEGWKLGDVQYVLVRDTWMFANCATQDEYWSPGDASRVYVDYPAIKTVMQKLLLKAKPPYGSPRPPCRVAMPKIGSGLAGGDWTQIETITNEVFQEVPIQVYINSQF